MSKPMSYGPAAEVLGPERRRRWSKEAKAAIGDRTQLSFSRVANSTSKPMTPIHSGGPDASDLGRAQIPCGLIRKHPQRPWGRLRAPHTLAKATPWPAVTLHNR
jgi:hypothetical protein